MIIAVCGGRKFGDIASLQKRYPLTYRSHPEWIIRQEQYDFVFRTLSLAAAEFSTNYRTEGAWVASDLKFVFGDATGTDAATLDWCRAHNVPHAEHAAEWEMFGRAAGPIRNQEILDKEQPELLIAFPGHRGTADMLRRAARMLPKDCIRQINYQIARNINDASARL